MTKTVIIADRAVAADHWTRPFDEVLADAQAGMPGLRVEERPVDDRGYLDREGLLSDVALLIRMPSGSCELWQQCW